MLLILVLRDSNIVTSSGNFYRVQLYNLNVIMSQQILGAQEETELVGKCQLDCGQKTILEFDLGMYVKKCQKV